MRPAAGGRSEVGFTLIELMVVVSIISLLAAIALPRYKVSIILSKEAVLMEDLYRFRDVIDQYWADKGKYPASLEALVEEGYLREVPKDPITGAADWETVLDDSEIDDPAATPGIRDVRSAAATVSLAGTPYNEW